VAQPPDGARGGELRGDIDPWRQVADWRGAISYLEARPEVDPTRIGVWGTSHAGGHAVVLGATDRWLRCLVAHVPTISGFEQGLRRVSVDAAPGLEQAFNDDERARLDGAPPQRQAVVSDDPSVRRLSLSGRIYFYLQSLPERRVGERDHAAFDASRTNVRTRPLDISRFCDTA
jgi:hypothetical protein